MLAAAALAAALTGCKAGPQKISEAPPAAVDVVDALHVQTPFVPENWDQRPGPDGLAVFVLLFRRDRDLPVTVDGTIDCALYAGAVQAEQIAQVEPTCSWSFQGRQLRDCLIRTIFGWGYAMRLGWGQAVPTASSVTLLVRYVPKAGPPVASDPIVIPMRPG